MADNKVNSGLLEFSEDQKVFVALDAETSEVKKAVTIDGDGVETDMLGVQPTGKKEITSTAEVNVASYATAQVVDEDLVAGNIKKDVDILGVVGSYEGGGASDFSTVDITVINNTGNIITAFIPTILEAGDLGTGSPAAIISTTLIQPSENTKTVPLYKGGALVEIPGELTISITGDIVAMDANSLYITGSGTVTINTQKS